MKRAWIGLAGVSAALLVGVAVFAGHHEEEKWVSLFNGKDLTGWTPKVKGHDTGENPGNIFRVEDGLLTVSYDQYDQFAGQFGHLFYKDSFSHYRLRLEVRFIGEQLVKGPGWANRNSGIMIHGQTPESMGKDQNFPVSLEVQLLGGKGDGKDRPTGNLCTPGTHVVMGGKLHKAHCKNSASKTYHGEQWVKVEVEVHGNDLIKHIVDGEVVMEYSKPQYDPKDKTAQPLIEDGNLMISGGTISLQAESHPCQFRNVEILVLDE